MLLAYGHASIKWKGEAYTLTPSFSNIAKLGAPKQIIDKFKRFIMLGNTDLNKWHMAMEVLRACCDKEFPPEMVGCTVFSERKQRFMYCQPSHGESVFHDCIVMADHCLRHGVCGVFESDRDDDDAKPVSEFDPYHFMEMAMEHLQVSRKDAASMTMTEFARRMAVKFPPQKSDHPSKKEQREMLEWFNQTNGVH